MVPDPCGAKFEAAVAAGADPKQVIPDDYIIIRGGTSPMPSPGQLFSGAAGPSLAAAAAAIPFGKLRFTTAGAIRVAGGTVEWAPEISRYQTINRQHVNITEGGRSTFSDLQPNPVPRRQRIDGDKP
jgi:hypothetical protein